MKRFYKITSIQEKKTKKSDIVYSMQLDNTIWINNINPNPIWESSGKKNYGLIDKFNKVWVNNASSLDSLKGKYICALFSESDYGLQFDHVESTDMIEDFKDELDNSMGQSFYSELPIYDFLEQAKYKINDDGSINIKSPFTNTRIKKIDDATLCYSFYDSNNILTLENIEAIFNKFYSHLKSETGGNNIFKHRIPSSMIGIAKETYDSYVSNKMTRSGDYSRWENEIILRLGDRLSDEQKLFLQGNNL